MRSALLAIVLLLTGCANNPFGAGNDRAETPKEIVKLGVIESITPIEMDASTSAGSMVGGIFGQVGGSNAGGGRGAVTGTILGAILGGTLGSQADIATQPGLEIWVKLDSENKSVYVMQPGKADAFMIGEQVRVVRKNGEVRVEPVNARTEIPQAPGPNNK
jgi:outer membrane lipoprotein SlyB